MAATMMPHESGRFIAENSKDVFIKPDGVTKIAKVMAECIKSGAYSIKSWKQHTLNPKTMDKTALDWIFFADTLNFSFWSEDEDQKYMVNYKGTEYTGYWSLCAAMNRALDEGIPLLEPTFYATISQDKLAHIFRSDSDHDIPLLEDRLHVIQEAGKILLKKYDGKFENVIKESDQSAHALLKLVTQDFPSYRDETEFGGKTVAIYKRAQILIADIWACFEGEGHGEFKDIDTITMFADYRIPQALMFFGALEYSEALKEYLSKNHLMKTGDRYEVEIRGCSIWCTEQITEETKKLLATHTDNKHLIVNSILIDHYLWDYRREHANDMVHLPFHRIRCIYY